jgi:hypothetical protein
MAAKMRFAHQDWEGYVSISDTAFTWNTTLLCQAMLKRKRKRIGTEPKTTEKELNEYTSTEAQAGEAAEQQQQP